MSTRHRDFDAARAEMAREPLTFKFNDVTFTVGAVGAGALLDLIASMEGTEVETVAAFGRFVLGVVVEEQRDQFREALNAMSFNELDTLARWVIEESIGRPLPTGSPSEPSASEPSEPLPTASLNPVGETPSG